MFKDGFLPDTKRLVIRIWVIFLGMGITYLAYFAAAEAQAGIFERLDPRRLQNMIWLLRVAGPVSVASAVWTAIPLVKAFVRRTAVTGNEVHIPLNGRRVRALLVEQGRPLSKCRVAGGDEYWVPHEQIDWF